LSKTDKIIDTSVVEEMRNSFLEYSMSVIVSRALPDVRDGLKPVHRRILYGMHEMGLKPGSPYKKCARVVGDVMGKLHPHGDSAIYEALVRMAQDFAMRLPTVDGHGNFGSLGNEDPPAAMRYTECRLAHAAIPMVGEIDEDTIEFRPNYDGTEREPEVLPAAFPNLLVNGSSGIAVGMATNMAQHNLGEVVAGLRAMLANDQITLDELMTYIPGPDMPTGTFLIGADGIREAYETGRGTFRMRATTKIEDVSARKKGIVVTELPYTVGPEKVISKIKLLQQQKRLLGVSGVVDLSDRKVGLRLVIEVKTGFNPQAVLEELYKLTPLEETFGVNNVCLVNGQPQTLGLLALCRHYLNHRIEVITRRTRFRLRKAEARMHIVEGLLIALQAIDEVVAAIKSSRDTDSARKKLMREFKLSEVQANHILEMPLRRQIAEYKKLLGSDKLLRELVGAELQEVADRFGTPRRSRLLAAAPDPGVSAAALQIADDPCVVTVSTTGLISRVEWADGKSVVFKGKHGRHDGVVATLTTTNRAVIGGVTDRGRLLRVSAIELPKAEGRNRGGAVKEFFADLHNDETVIALIALPDPKSAEARTAAGMALATAQGTVKRITPDAFPLKSGQEIIGLKDGDRLVGVVTLPSEDVDLVFVTDTAQLLRTPVNTIRPQGRTGGGVAGMKVGEGKVIAFGVLDPATSEKAVLATATNAGSAKMSKLAEYPAKGRGGGGVRCHTFRKDEDKLVGAYVGTGTPLAMTAGEPQPMPAEMARRDSAGTVKFDVPVTTVAVARS
jgi:DNA gyrase subunit A